ncbi:ecto-ADP-ribosyltransferase 5-like [Chaetodon auriga]|uniref:ecto-ADP-ribosyltransferase 5-like n=1 Tax=Chaetodon auriga TaxID=39042 RepID=UPI004032D1FD
MGSPHEGQTFDWNDLQLLKDKQELSSTLNLQVTKVVPHHETTELWFLCWLKMAVIAVWAAVLMTCGASPGISKDTAQPGLKAPLDLAPNAVDDMYTGCKDKMEYRVKKEYLANEKNKDKNFTLAWGEAEKYYNKKWKHRKGKRPPTSLGKEQIMAIYVYTLDKPKIYFDFNNAVRTQKSKYKTTFRYHALHFFLTDALQTLNARKPEEERCLTGYRRVNSYFSQDVLNKLIRFGTFTSSSMGRYPGAYRFGDKSCFEIITCSGADVSLYSKLGESEREALIPPYEVFKVTKIERRSEQRSLPCEVVYKVKSTGKTLSNTNCALF